MAVWLEILVGQELVWKQVLQLIAVLVLLVMVVMVVLVLTSFFFF